MCSIELFVLDILMPLSALFHVKHWVYPEFDFILILRRVFVLIGIWFFILALLYVKYLLFHVKQKKEGACMCLPGNRLRSPIS